MCSGHGRRRRRGLIAIAVVAILVAAWFTGLAGRLTSDWILPTFLPLPIGGAIRITDISANRNPVVCDRGAVLTVSSLRANDMLRHAVWWSRFLPPALIRDGLEVRASWVPPASLPGGSWGFILIVDDNVGWRPRLVGRCPAGEFNAFMRAAYGEKWTQKKKWALGTYDLSYRPTFESCRIYSGERDLTEPVNERSFLYEATGTIQVKIEKSLIDASATGRVTDFRGNVDVHISRDVRGVGLDYTFKVNVLDINVYNLAEWGDETLSEELRESMTRSLNKPKKRQTMAGKRFPTWIPLDLALDFQLTP